MELPLNCQHTSFQSSHFFGPQYGPLASGHVVDSAVRGAQKCLREQTAKQKGLSLVTCTSLLGAQTWGGLPRDLLNACLLPLCFQGRLRRPRATGKPLPPSGLAPCRPPLLTVKHDRWPGGACRRTSKPGPVCSSRESLFLFQGTQKTFPESFPPLAA